MLLLLLAEDSIEKYNKIEKKKRIHKHQYFSLKKSAMNQSRHNYPPQGMGLVESGKWIGGVNQNQSKNDNLTAIRGNSKVAGKAGPNTTVIRKIIITGDSEYIHFSLLLFVFITR